MKYAILLTALLFTSISNAATWVSPIDKKYINESPDLFEVYVEARNLLDSHRGKRSTLISAKEKLDLILSEDGKFAPAYREYARLYMKAGHISYGNFEAGALGSAEAAILESIRIEPEYADAFVLLGHLYTKNKSYEKAENSLKKAGIIGTKLPWFHLNYADLLKRTNRFDQALPHYMAVVDSETDNKNAYSSALLGTALYYRGKNNLPEAEKWFLKSAEYDKSAWNWGEYSYFMTFWVGDFDKAVEGGEKALSIMSYGIGRSNLAYAYYGKWYELRKSDPEQAETFYAKASSLLSDTDKVISKLMRYKPTRNIAVELQKHVAKVPH